MAATAIPTQPGKASLIVTIGVVTVLGGAGGGLAGKMLVGRLQAAASNSTAAEGSHATAYGDTVEVHELPAIVTNLANPSDTRVRLQVSIVYPKKGVENPSILQAQVAEDLVAFMKTVSLKDLEGASGIENLREDLNDRAATRSQGKVSEVIIEALVLQ